MSDITSYILYKINNNLFHHDRIYIGYAVDFDIVCLMIVALHPVHLIFNLYLEVVFRKVVKSTCSSKAGGDGGGVNFDKGGKPETRRKTLESDRGCLKLSLHMIAELCERLR